MDATQMICDSVLESDENENEEENDNKRGRPLAKLCILKNEHIPETELPLFLGNNVLGRDPNTCTLQLPASSVSKQHATICISVYRRRGCHGKRDMEALMWDLGSMNGTRKGRLKLTPNVRYALSEGDSLVVADIPCQYVSCGVDSVSFQEDTGTPVSTNSAVKARLADASGEKGGDTSTGNKKCVNGGTKARVSLKQTPVRASCLSFEQTPTQPQGTLVPESDSDSDSERGKIRSKALVSDSDSHKSSPIQSTFLSPTNQIVPESEDESPITPSSSAKDRPYRHISFSTEETDANVGRQQLKEKKALAIVDDSEEEKGKKEERAAQGGTKSKESGQHVPLKQESSVSPTGENESPVSTPAPSTDAIPAFNMDSDTDVEREEEEEEKEEEVASAGPVTLNTKQQVEQAPNSARFHMDSDTDVEEDEDVLGEAPKTLPNPKPQVGSVIQPESITMDIDTEVEDDAAGSDAATKAKATSFQSAHTAESASSLQPKDFHPDGDTDVDDEEEEGDCGTNNKNSKTDETPNKSDLKLVVPESTSAAVHSLHLDSDTDDEAIPAPAISKPSVVAAATESCSTAGADLDILSDSDTDVEGDPPLVAPVVVKNLSVSPGATSEALPSDLNADTDVDGSSMPTAGVGANPVDLRVDSDTDMEDKEAGADLDILSDSDTDVEGDPPLVAPVVVKNLSVSPGATSEALPSDLDADTDVDESSMPTVGVGANPVDLRVDSDTDMEDKEAGADLDILSDSDTDVEGDPPLVAPVVVKNLSVSPGATSEALPSDLDADTDVDESSMPTVGVRANPVDLRVDSDTDMEDKEADIGEAGEDQIDSLHRQNTPRLLVPLLPNCSTPVLTSGAVSEGEVEEMETQAFLIPSSVAVRPAVLSFCSDSQEDDDFVVFETPSFAHQTQDHLISMEPTQAFLFESPGDKKDDKSSGGESFQLGLSASSHLQLQEKVLAVESTQAFVSVGEGVNLEDTQPYSAVSATERTSAENDSNLEATQAYGEVEEPARCSALSEKEGPVDWALEATQTYISESYSDPKDSTDEDEGQNGATTETQPSDFPTSSTLAMAETQPMPLFVGEESFSPGNPVYSVQEVKPRRQNETEREEHGEPAKPQERLFSEAQSTTDTQPMFTSYSEESDDEDSFPRPRKRIKKPLQLEEEQMQSFTGSETQRKHVDETQPMAISEDHESDDADLMSGPRKRKEKRFHLEEEQTQQLTNSELSVAETQPIATCEEDDEDSMPGPRKRKVKPLQLEEEETQQLTNSELSVAETQPIATCEEDDEDSMPGPRKRKVKPLQLEEEQTQPLTSTDMSAIETQTVVRGEEEENDDEDSVTGPRKKKKKQLHLEEEETQPLAYPDVSAVQQPQREKGRQSEVGTTGASVRNLRETMARLREEEEPAECSVPAKRQTRGDTKTLPSTRGMRGRARPDDDNNEEEVKQAKRGRGKKSVRQQKEEDEMFEIKRNKKQEEERLGEEKDVTDLRQQVGEKTEKERREIDNREREQEEIERQHRREEGETLENESKVTEKQERLQTERKRHELESAEKERLERERKKEEKERLQREKVEREEKERLEREMAEKEEKERLEREMAEREEKERLEREKAEREEKERLEREKAEREEKERLEREKAERVEKERLEREKAERVEKERLERERKEQEEKELEERLERERNEKEHQARLERGAREREEREQLDKEKEAKEQSLKELQEEDKPSRGRRAASRATTAQCTAEPEQDNNDYPARRTRSRSNSSNSVSSEMSASSVNTQESKGRGRGRGTKRTSELLRPTPVKSSNRRTVAAARPPERGSNDICLQRLVSRSNSSSSLNSEISSCSVSSQNRGRGGMQRGRGRKTESDHNSVPVVVSRSDQSSAPKPTARGRKSRKTESSSSEVLYDDDDDDEERADSQQAGTIRGRQRANGNGSAAAVTHQEDQSNQEEACASEESLQPKSKVRGRGHKAVKSETLEAPVAPAARDDDEAKDKRTRRKSELEANTGADCSHSSKNSKGKEKAQKTEAAEEERADETKDETRATVQVKRGGRTSSSQVKNAKESVPEVEANEREKMEVESVEKRARGRTSVLLKKKNEGLEESGTSVTSVNQDANEASEPQTPASSASRKRQASTDSSPAAKTPRSSSASPAASVRLRAVSQAYKVLFTGVVDEAGERVLAHLGGSIAKGVADMNCLVTDKVRRTVKFLCAVAKGIPVVTTDWLEKSGKAGSFLSPNAFLVKDPEQEKKFCFCLQESLRIASSQPLLQGYEIHVTKSVKPEPVQMKDIISSSRATFLSKMPSSPKPQTVVISCEEDWRLCGPALSASLPVVTAEFILTGILQQKLDFQTHKLSPPTANLQPAGGRGRSRRNT
ncbi:mediator of DNA damage checkpoint protein 1 isoform X2 [Embiotoca jacksoni]|uniref:mediator of DNA damage checkpoint protein 1 isoform X2 n=1 Tax=Embiotoca jacksoni TaxID=100190 RepID=UPI00370476E2